MLKQFRINLPLLLQQVKNYKAYAITFAVLFFITYPAAVLLRLLRPTRDSSFYIETIPLYLIFVAIIAFFIIPFVFQGYLNSKKATDVYHSLPIKRSELFLTNNLAAFLVVFVPFTINYFLGYGLHAVEGSPIEWLRVIAYFAASAFLFAAIQSCSNIAILNTGTLANGLVHAGILFASPFVAFGALSNFVNRFIFGVASFDSVFLSYLSPAYALFRFTYDGSIKLVLFGGLFWLLVNLVCLFVFFRVYNKRKSEQAEEPFTNPRYFPTVVSLFSGLTLLGLMALVNPSGYEPDRLGLRDFFVIDTFLIPVGFTFVIYVILDFFRYKSTKNFLKSTLQFLIIAATVTALSATMIVTGLFGFDHYIPSPSLVNQVTLTVEAPLSFSFTNYAYQNDSMILHEKESIQEVAAFHKQILDFYHENPNFSHENQSFKMNHHAPVEIGSEVGTVSFVYRMRGGFTVRRRYTIPSALVAHLYTLRNNFDVQANLNPILDQDVEIHSTQTLYNSTFTKMTKTTLSLEDRQQLIKSYRNDLAKLDDKTMAFEASTLQYGLAYTIITKDNFGTLYEQEATLFIDDRFSETVDFLASLDNNPILIGGASYGLAETGSLPGLIAPQYGIPLTTSNDHIEIPASIHSINLEDAMALEGQVQGSHLRSIAKKVLVVEINRITYYLPLDIK